MDTDKTLLLIQQTKSVLEVHSEVINEILNLDFTDYLSAQRLLDKVTDFSNSSEKRIGFTRSSLEQRMRKAAFFINPSATEEYYI